jgi:hypothetical protein
LFSFFVTKNGVLQINFFFPFLLIKKVNETADLANLTYTWHFIRSIKDTLRKWVDRVIGIIQRLSLDTQLDIHYIPDSSCYSYIEEILFGPQHSLIPKGL